MTTKPRWDLDFDGHPTVRAVTEAFLWEVSDGTWELHLLREGWHSYTVPNIARSSDAELRLAGVPVEVFPLAEQKTAIALRLHLTPLTPTPRPKRKAVVSVSFVIRSNGVARDNLYDLRHRRNRRHPIDVLRERRPRRE